MVMVLPPLLDMLCFKTLVTLETGITSIDGNKIEYTIVNVWDVGIALAWR